MQMSHCSHQIPVQVLGASAPNRSTNEHTAPSNQSSAPSSESSALDFLYNKAQGDFYSTDYQQTPARPYYNKLLYDDLSTQQNVGTPDSLSPPCGSGTPLLDKDSSMSFRPLRGAETGSQRSTRNQGQCNVQTVTNHHPMPSRCDTGKINSIDSLVERANSQTLSVDLGRHSADDDAYYTPIELQHSTTAEDMSAHRTIDKSSIRQHLREGEEIGRYNQTSIRYTGKTNPSRLFKILQSKTGSDSDTPDSSPTTRRRSQRQAQNESADDQGQHSDDVVDIRYIGSSIPSRTFRNLQQAIGDPVDCTPNSSEDDCYSQMPGRDIQVVHLRQNDSSSSSRSTPTLN